MAKVMVSVPDQPLASIDREIGASLASCDVRDLVSRGLAVLPSQAR